MQRGTGKLLKLVKAMPLVVIDCMATCAAVIAAAWGTRELGEVLNGSVIPLLKRQIPLRILKMRQVFSEKKPGAFALPANEMRTEIAAFPQVKHMSFAGLRTLRRVPSHSTAASGDTSQFLAKRVFKYRFETKVAA